MTELQGFEPLYQRVYSEGIIRGREGGGCDSAVAVAFLTVSSRRDVVSLRLEQKCGQRIETEDGE